MPPPGESSGPSMGHHDTEAGTVNFARNILKVASGRYKTGNSSTGVDAPMLDEHDRRSHGPEIDSDDEGNERLHTVPQSTGQSFPGTTGQLGESTVSDSEVEGYDEDHLKGKAPLLKQHSKGPLEHRWNFYPLFLLLWLLGGAGYYLYVRITQLHGSNYGLFILVVECIGLSSFIPYAVLLTRGVYPTGSPGLPPAEETLQPLKGEQPDAHNKPSPHITPRYSHQGPDQGFGSPFLIRDKNPISSLPEGKTLLASDPAHKYHVRVMVPCYKEPLEVVAATLEAAYTAPLPANTVRTIYLCDDGKDPNKKALVEAMGPDIVYVTGRKRKVNEINGKSANLNNCLKNVIYAKYPRTPDGEIDWTEISHRELLVVFDADMCAKPEFFLRLMEVMMNDDYALVLSPQSFHNISRDADLFNNINKQFWECWLPGAFAWGYIACTGTNFMIRARALAHCGWFPDYTITEDYALGMELKTRGYKATYMMLYLAVGEAPDEIRNVFRQRSRWQKGHFQVFFSGRNPLLNFGLPFFQRLWYSYAAWAPITTIITIPSFMAVPFLSIALGWNPVTITFQFVLSATIFYTAQALISNYSFAWGDWKLMWFANGSNIVLWFTYLKALFNSFVARLGLKVVAFKVTEKKQTEGGAATTAALQPQRSMLARLARALTPRRAAAAPEAPLLPHHRLATSSSQADSSLCLGAVGHLPPLPPSSQNLPHSGSLDRHTRSAAAGTAPGSNQAQANLQKVQSLRSQLSSGIIGGPASGGNSHVRGASPLQMTEHGKKDGWQRFKAVIKSFKPAHVKEFDEMFDPLVLLLLFLFSAATFGFGIWETAKSVHQRASVQFAFNSPVSGSPYLIIATLWAFFNCIFPYLFLHYCITAGATFKWAAKILMFLSHFVLIITTVLIWLLIPTEFDVAAPIKLQTKEYLPSQVVKDTNTNFQVLMNGTQFDTTKIQAPVFPVQSTNAKRRLQMVETDENGWVHHTPSDFDPAALSDDELNGPGPMAAWQRALLQAGDNVNAALRQAPLPANVDLSGGLLVKDHVKYNMPMAYSITQLAWALLEYPQGFKQEQYDSAMNVIKQGSEYLMRCLLQTKDGKLVYVAQVGDPVDYLVVDGMVEDPAASGKVWTKPEQDPFLLGTKTRKVWLLDEDHVGSDLLAQVAAALAATSEVYKTKDPAFSAQALTIAEKVYSLAIQGTDKALPHSYCEYIPCTAKVQVTKKKRTVPVELVDRFIPSPPPVPTNASDATCWVADFTKLTCRALLTAQECMAASTGPRSNGEVYRDQPSCCARMASSGVWDNAGPMGVCGVPTGQQECFISYEPGRTCFTEQINPLTGNGCAGKGLQIFSSKTTCCKDLFKQGIVNSADKPPAGICSANSFGDVKNFKECFILDLTQRTCVKSTNLAQCQRFAATGQFDDQQGCCNFLVEQLVRLARGTATGICKETPQPQSPPTDANGQLAGGQGNPQAGGQGFQPAGGQGGPQNGQPNGFPQNGQPNGFPQNGQPNGLPLNGQPNGLPQNGQPNGLPQNGQPNGLPPNGRRLQQQQQDGMSFAPVPGRRSLLQTSTPGTPVTITVAPTPPGAALPASPRPGPLDPVAAGKWQIPSSPPPLGDVAACVPSMGCDFRDIQEEVEVAFYNSTSVLDDLAWGGLWLYRASGKRQYQGEGKKFLAQLYALPGTPHRQNRDRDFYVPSWDNVLWGANLLLLQQNPGNPLYDQRLHDFFTAWVIGKQIPAAPGVPTQDAINITIHNTPLKQNTTSGQLVYVLPECKATSTSEEKCDDDIDNDCDGLKDREDPDCGMFPMLYTNNNLAYSRAPSLPNAAAVAWLGMLYGETLQFNSRQRLRCWALGQVAYMMGAAPNTRSYVVGYKNAPTIVNHMASSCPTEGECNWDNGYWPALPNAQPQLIGGALLAGPNFQDQYVDVRTHPNSKISLDGTTQLTGVLAGLQSTGTRLRSCELNTGVYQRVFTNAAEL